MPVLPTRQTRNELFLSSQESKKKAVLPILPTEKRPGFEWRSGIKAVLDIGSTKTTCLIGRGLQNGGIQILGWGWRRSEGIQSGNIVDTRQAEAVIRASVGDAEKQSGRHIDDLIVNLSSGNPASHHTDVSMMIGNREVVESDVLDLLEDARLSVQRDGREIIQALPLGFNVDETHAVPNPCGHLCQNLLGKFHLIDANTSTLRTLSTVLNKAELRLSGLVSSPFAAGLSVLDHDERDLGVTVVEMGAGTTSLAIFSHGKLLHTAQLRIGGHHITRDIASALNVHTDTAEWLKTMHGAAQYLSENEDYTIRLPPGGDRIAGRISRARLISIIAPRVEEILEMTRHALDSAGLGQLAEGRIVLTGGASLLTDIGPVAARIFGRQLRLGQPINVHNLPENSTISAGFSTASGLLAWALGANAQFSIAETSLQGRNWMKRLVNFIGRHV